MKFLIFTLKARGTDLAQEAGRQVGARLELEGETRLERGAVIQITLELLRRSNKERCPCRNRKLR